VNSLGQTARKLLLAERSQIPEIGGIHGGERELPEGGSAGAAGLVDGGQRKCSYELFLCEVRSAGVLLFPRFRSHYRCVM